MKTHNTIEIKYKDSINSINYLKFSNLNDIILTITNLFQLQFSNEEIISLFYIEKNRDFDKISINSIEDIEQIALFHYKNYKDNLQFEVSIILNSSSKNSSNLLEEDNDNYDDHLYLSENKSKFDEILETKVTKIINSNLNDLQSSNIIENTMTINNLSKNFIDESFEFSPEVFNNNQEISKCHCKTVSNPPQSNSVNNLFWNTNKEDNNLKLQKEKNNTIHFSHANICSNCFKTIKEYQFICILCSKFQLCDKCFHQHSQFHPMLLLSNNQNNICSLKELAEYLKQKKSFIKKELSTPILSSLYSVIYPPFLYKLKIYPFAKINALAIAQGEKTKFQIVIENLSQKPIESNLVFQIKNIKNLSIIIEPIQKIKSEGVQITDMIIAAGVHKEDYKLSITLQARDIQINCNKIKLIIKVVNKKSLIDENINIFFRDQVKIQQMNKNDKIKLYNIIIKGSIKKDVHEIDDMLKKYNYNLNKTLEELSSQIEENAEEDDS